MDNTSEWSTDDLLEIVERCAEYRGVELENRLRSKRKRTRTGVNKWKPLRIGTSKTQGDGWYTGRCYGGHFGDSKCSPRNTGNIYLGVPHHSYESLSGEEKTRSFDEKRFAQVVLHEIDHLLGLAHKDMMDSRDLSTPELSDVSVSPKEE